MSKLIRVSQENYDLMSNAIKKNNFKSFNHLMFNLMHDFTEKLIAFDKIDLEKEDDLNVIFNGYIDYIGIIAFSDLSSTEKAIRFNNFIHNKKV